MIRSPLLYVLLCLVPCVAAPAAQAQAPRDLLFPVPVAEAPRIALDTPVLRTRTAAFDPSALEAPVDLVRLELFDGRIETFRLERRDVHAPGDLTWSGKLDGESASTASFALTDGALCGSVRIRDRLWRIRSRADGLATIEEIDEARVPPCATTERHRIAHSATSPATAPQAVPSFAAAVTPTIDVMVVYTPAARIGQGGPAQMHALIDLAVLESNQIYSNSQVQQRMRLVHRGELVGYTSAGWATDMGRIHDPADGWLDYVHDWRAQSGADVIVIMQDDNGPNCGVAFLMGTLTTAFAPDAFAMVSRTCATGFYSFGHELGHVMGLGHDRDNSTDKIMRASYSSSLLASNAASYSPAVSRFGQFVAYLSDGTNLVPGDNNGFADVFLRDRQGFTTTRVNVGPGGVQANGFLLSAPAVSQSGALVAFDCTATNLVANDANGVGDVFVRDVAAGVTERVSVATGGFEANGQSYDTAMSADGRFVAFASDASNLVAGAGGTQVYLRDRQSGTTVLVSQNPLGAASNGVSRRPSVSDDGRFVSFTSVATDLVLGDTNGKRTCSCATCCSA